MEPIKTTRNIFLEIDAEKIINYLDKNPGTSQPIDVSQMTLIYDQGKMASGYAVKNFVIDANINEDLFFTILPSLLYSYNKFYLTSYIATGEGIEIPPSRPFPSSVVSFRLPVGNVMKNGEIQLVLFGVLEYEIAGQVITVQIEIDPVLRANQGNG